jgi:hypothetical protein
MAGPRAKKGDAESVLQAFGTGGFAILKHHEIVDGVPEGAPSQGLADSRVAIRPFSAWDGRHFCELDWHTILVADIEPIDETFTRQDAQAAIEQLTVNFTLDGQPLPVSRTATKHFNAPERFGVEEAVFAAWGRIMSPSDLGVGPHTLSLEFGGESDPAITFFIDQAGTGVCL